MQSSKLRQQGDWVYAKVGMTEVRGKKVPVGIDIEQVSPSYDPRDFDKAVKMLEEFLGRQSSAQPQSLPQDKYGPPETADPEVKELWRIALKETEAKYPIGHPDLVNEAKRAGVSQEETKKMIAHEIYLERRQVLIEKWAREHGLEKELKARDKEEEESPSLLSQTIEGGEPGTKLPTTEKLYQRAVDGYPIGADKLMRDAWGLIPNPDQPFWSRQGFIKPVKIYGWQWSPDYHSWRAYVRFPDGEETWTSPREQTGGKPGSLHHSPISAHCEDVLARPPKCEDFAKIRSFVMCRAWDLMEKEKRTKLPVSEAWQEARKVCTRE